MNALQLIFPSDNNKLWRVVSGALAASLYAVSNSLWQSSTVAEVYTLQNCFIVLIALLLVRGIKQTEKKSCLYLAGFSFRPQHRSPYHYDPLYTGSPAFSLAILPKLYSLISPGNHNYVRHLRRFYLSLPPGKIIS